MRSTLLHTALLGLVALLFPALAAAQDGAITGVVTDAEAEVPLPGANVYIEELGIGAATDLDGRYVIENVAPRPESYLVRASFTGYTAAELPATVTADETVTLDFPLTQGAELDEVVVTALGIQRSKRSLGYSAQEVEGDLVERSNESNVVNALAGKVAGLQVTSSSGQPGKAARITIRGNSSFTGNNQPLFVVDGVPISNAEDVNPEGSALFSGGTINRAVDLDPSIIAEVNVLKGAAAMALYGSRAANGAVIITTKGGRAGEAQPPRVTFSSNVRWDEAVIDGYQTQFAQGSQGCFQDGVGFVDEACFEAQGASVPGAPTTTLNWGPSIDELNQNAALLDALGVDAVPTIDPRADFYRTGLSAENSLSLSGSGLGGNYFLSGSYLDQEGIVPGTGMNRASLLAKYGANVTDKLGVETSINYVNTDNDWASEGNSAFAYTTVLNYAPLTYDLDQVGPDGEPVNVSYSTSRNNPYWLAAHNGFSSGVNRFIGSVGITYKLLPWLSLSERAGIDTYADTRKGVYDVGTLGRPEGSVFDQTINRREINSDLILQAERQQFGRIGLDVLVGNNVNYRDYAFNFINGRQLGIPGFFNVDNAAQITADQYEEERALVGVYTQATADYDDWAYLTLTARNDWSSTLPEGNNSYFYPSASLGLVFTEALGFLNDSPYLNYGKVRASVARIGNDAPVFSTSTVFVQAAPGDGVRGAIDFPFDGVNAYQESLVLGNPELKPELSTEYEAGLELQLLDNRLRFDAAYYDRTTQDQIFSVPVSAATGFVERLLNAGELRNNGYELSLGLTPVATEDFTWTVDANWSRNRAEVVELAEGVDNIFLAGFTGAEIRVAEGEDGYGVIWGSGFEYADPEVHADLFAANPGLEEGTLLIGEDGLPLVAPALGAIGNVQPDWTGNVRSSLSYKGLTLSGLVDIRQGGDILNMDLFYSSFYGSAEVTADRGSAYTYEGLNVATGQPNDVEIVRDQAFYQGFYSGVFENFVEDGSFVKLREISLSYDLPTRLVQRAGLQGATVTATGRNLWTATDFSYGDPEGSLVGAGNGQGFYHNVTPGTRSFSLGVRVSF